MSLPLWPFLILLGAPMLGFACGTAWKGRPFARAYLWVVVAYYSVVLGTYGLVFAAIALGATEAHAVVSAPQHVGCVLLLAGPIVGIWLVAMAPEIPKPIDPNVCKKCGYNLTGNVTGICSECGEAIEVSVRGERP